MLIREEIKGDLAHIEAIHLAAFPGAGESQLVTALRKNVKNLLSLVAVVDGRPVGHILFSPVILDSTTSLRLMGLAPMAVLPELQSKGIGSALVEAGLKLCRKAKIGAVAVLGHPEYYPKFGFEKSEKFNLNSEYDVPPGVFMIAELENGYLKNCSGTTSYYEEFSKL